MLLTSMGPIRDWLDDPSIADISLNPDGCLWIDRLAGGLEDTGQRLAEEDSDRFIKTVAHHAGVEVTIRSPNISAQLPGSKARFEGWIPPVVEAPTFTIRKRAVAVFTLAQYTEAGIMTAEQADILRDAVARRRNIMVVGGTSTGKTTLINALLAEVAAMGDRVILLEDTPELQCSVPNFIPMLTVDGIASLTDLVRSSLRQRPDRILIGEVRGKEALDLIKAWGTGHRGSGRSTPAARAMRWTGSNSSSRKPSSPFRGA
jgi:type IV secretion system protein TrbB